MRSVAKEGTIISKSQVPAIFPPFPPNKATVKQSRLRAFCNPLITLRELPLVEIPMTISPA